MRCTACEGYIKPTSKHYGNPKTQEAYHMRCAAGNCVICKDVVMTKTVNKDPIQYYKSNSKGTVYHRNCLESNPSMFDKLGRSVKLNPKKIRGGVEVESPRAPRAKVKLGNPKITTLEDFLKWWSKGLSWGLISYDGKVLKLPTLKSFADWWLHGFTWGFLKVAKPIGLEKGHSILDYIARSFTLGLIASSKDKTSVLKGYPSQRPVRLPKAPKGFPKLPKANPNIAMLTPEEDSAWNHAWEYYVNQGYDDDTAGQMAWDDLQQQFPRLREYEGARPDVPGRSNPYDYKRIKQSIEQSGCEMCHGPVEVDIDREEKVIQIECLQCGHEYWKEIPTSNPTDPTYKVYYDLSLSEANRSLNMLHRSRTDENRKILAGILEGTLNIDAEHNLDVPQDYINELMEPEGTPFTGNVHPEILKPGDKRIYLDVYESSILEALDKLNRQRSKTNIYHFVEALKGSAGAMIEGDMQDAETLNYRWDPSLAYKTNPETPHGYTVLTDGEIREGDHPVFFDKEHEAVTWITDNLFEEHGRVPEDKEYDPYDVHPVGEAKPIIKELWYKVPIDNTLFEKAVKRQGYDVGSDGYYEDPNNYYTLSVRGVDREHYGAIQNLAKKHGATLKFVENPSKLDIQNVPLPELDQAYVSGIFRGKRLPENEMNIIYSEIERRKQTTPSARRLPIITYQGKRYFVDKRLNELRNVEVPWEAIRPIPHQYNPNPDPSINLEDNPASQHSKKRAKEIAKSERKKGKRARVVPVAGGRWGVFIDGKRETRIRIPKIPKKYKKKAKPRGKGPKKTKAKKKQVPVESVVKEIQKEMKAPGGEISKSYLAKLITQELDEL